MGRYVDFLIQLMQFAGVAVAAIAVLVAVVRTGLASLAGERSRQMTTISLDLARTVLIGLDRIMWGADMPHLEGTYPYSREALRAAFAGVPADEVRLMVGGTAAAVYSFDLDALQSVAEAIGPTVDEVATPLLDPPKFPEQTVTPALAPAGMSSRGR